MNDTSGTSSKFATGINNIGGKFATGVIGKKMGKIMGKKADCLHLKVNLKKNIYLVHPQNVRFQNVWFQNVRFQSVRFTKHQVYKTLGFKMSCFKTSSF
jgi:hypothetical protein